jgi:hypothetical protein
LARTYDELMAWIVAADYHGYDPYDGLHTRRRWQLASRNLRLVQTYLHKFSPVNLRPVLGVTPSLDNQGAALIMMAACRRPPAGVQVDLERLVHHITARSLHAGMGHHCWNGHPFAVQMRDSYQSPDVPGVIGTEACASALLAYLQLHPERAELQEYVLGARRFFLDALFTVYEGAAFFRYKPITPVHSCTYNASAVAAAFVARVNSVFGLTDEDDRVARAFHYVASRQNADGSWFYSVDLRSGWQKPQIDYHQGFILNSIMDYEETGAVGLGETYSRGLRFYRERQFEDDGRGLYRYPRRWPVNIQEQAQGIATFSRAARRDPAFGEFAARVAGWTIAHMRSPKGYFYYHRYPGFVNRIPYMRWSNASMAAALASHLTPDPPAAVS